MTKREERDHKFRLLFSSQFFAEEELDAQIKNYFDASDYEDNDEETDLPASVKGLTDEDMKYLTEEVQKIVEKIPELDEKINSRVQGWTTERITKTDLTVIRLGLYEMLYDDRIPERVAINEAVEIAKKYGGPASGAFVNGLLARITAPEDTLKDVKKPVRKKAGEVKEKLEEDKHVHILINKNK